MTTDTNKYFVFSYNAKSGGWAYRETTESDFSDRICSAREDWEKMWYEEHGDKTYVRVSTGSKQRILGYYESTRKVGGGR